jgi:hypothetical protein
MNFTPPETTCEIESDHLDDLTRAWWNCPVHQVGGMYSDPNPIWAGERTIAAHIVQVRQDLQASAGLRCDCCGQPFDQHTTDGEDGQPSAAAVAAAVRAGWTAVDSQDPAAVCPECTARIDASELENLEVGARSARTPA